LGSLLQWELGAIAAIGCAVPVIRRQLNQLYERLRTPSPTAARWTAIALSGISSIYFVLAAYFQAWDLILRFQDEYSYALQIQMLAHGRLWMPALSPQVADFFNSLNIFTSPTYGSMYFPGTALLFVPTVWLHLPWWVMPVMAGGACIGLTYLALLELTDGVLALLGAVMLASLPVYRAASLMLLSQMPMLLFGLSMMLAWLRWRRKPTAWRCVLIGVFAGWAAITRPLDALCFALPIGVGILLDLRSRPWRRDFPPLPVRRERAWVRVFDRAESHSQLEDRPHPNPLPEYRERGSDWRVLIKSAVCLLLGAVPFLALQAVQNKGMTGRWTQFPIDLFHARTYPAPVLGFYDVDWAHAPLPALAEDRELVQTSAWPLFRDHTIGNIPRELWTERLPRTLRTTLPWLGLAILLPVGLLGLIKQSWASCRVGVLAHHSPSAPAIQRWASTPTLPEARHNLPRVVFAMVPVLFVVFYIPYIFYQPHYIIVAAPGVILLVLLGIQVIRDAPPGARAWLEPLLVMVPLGLAIGSFAFVDETTWASWQDLSRIEGRLAELPNQPALVLFRYHPYHPEWNICFHEPVYNTQTASLDDATILRAHDLGPENGRLFSYYAQRQPGRVVYLYDRADDSMTRLGTAGELAATYNRSTRSSDHGG